MGSEPTSEEIEAKVGVSRRRFVHRMVVGTAFVAPLVASFDMTSLSMGVANAQSNQTSP